MGMLVTNVMDDCDSKNRGEMIYVTDSNAVYICEEKGWKQSGSLVGKDTIYSKDTVYSKDTLYSIDTIYSVVRDTLV